MAQPIKSQKQKHIFELSKNAYQEGGYLLKNNEVMTKFKGGEEVVGSTITTQNKTMFIPGRVFGDLRGIFVSADVAKKLKLPKPIKGGAKIFIEMEI